MLKVAKKVIMYASLTLMAVSLPAAGVSAYASAEVAVGSTQAIFADGRQVPLTAYNINGNNYVRLRDVGYVIDFEVLYDASDDSVRIFADEPYSSDLPMLGQAQERAEATLSRQTIYVDDLETPMLAYSIRGNNYVKLRDIGAAVDFSVVWDAVQNRVVIDSTKPYTPEGPGAPQATEPESPAPIPNNPGSTAVDYSLQANPAIFDWYYTREKYNDDRQRVLDSGTNVNWGLNRPPQSVDAIEAADSFFSSIAHLSNQDKVKSINEYLSSHITYSLNVAFIGNDFWTGMAYGVCEDFARMAQYMCHRAGIPCLYIAGTRSPVVTTGLHAWNEVYFDGSWHFYDATMSASLRRIILSDTSVTANTGYTYTDDSPQLTMYYKEVFVPGSTL